MAHEIERKYLVKDQSWREGAGSGTRYRQGYLSLDRERVVRVRTRGEQAYLTIKGARQGLRAAEYEYPIPLPDAMEMLEELCLHPLIDKIRYEVLHERFTWEIDEFLGENEGLVVAEVELESEEQELVLPPWVGEEVSRDPRYANASLVTYPFREWG